MSINLKDISFNSSVELKNSLFVELIQHFLDISLKVSWLQGTVNLLKQFIDAKKIALVIHSDNLVINSRGDDNFGIDLLHLNMELVQGYSCKSIWKDGRLLVNLSGVGSVLIEWYEMPHAEELAKYSHIFTFLEQSLFVREELIKKNHHEQNIELLQNIEKVLSEKGDLKDKLDTVVKEIGMFFRASRCQFKVFADSAGVLFDNSYSAEFVKDVYVDALSVVPAFEQEWIKDIREDKYEVFQLHPEPSIDSKSLDIESLLSIKSVCGFPLIYGGKPVGVLILHECSYPRNWLSSEIVCLKQIALVLSIFIGRELQNDLTDNSPILKSSPMLLNADDFMRELSHVQMQSQINNFPFSLILIDVSEFKDINLKWGFVAGNLVIAQTSRFLQRHYGHKYLIARYNNDEFILILPNVDERNARFETEKLKSKLGNICVLGIGPVDYNYSFVTYPSHGKSISEILNLLGKSMIISKSRGKSGMCGVDEIMSEPRQFDNLEDKLLTGAFIEPTSFKTGPELIEIIKKQVNEQEDKNIFNPDLLDSIQSLALALDAKDSYTEGHSKRVSEYAFILAKDIGLELKEQEWVRLAACMHDIGKIGIPESILCKPDKLTKDEFEIMKKHPVIGARILKPIKPLEKVANLVLYHHENWNGYGYPHGLSKTEIPIGARIVSIVDAYQAMTSDRPYRARLPQEEAIKRLRAGKEKQWDPDLIESFIKVIV